MGGYFSSSGTRSVDIDSLLLKASSPDDPILSQAISDYQHNKEVIEHREDLNWELKTALIHSIDDELKLVEAKQQILSLKADISEINKQNSQLKTNVQKLKSRVNKLKYKVEQLTIIIYSVLGTLILLYLFAHFFWPEIEVEKVAQDSQRQNLHSPTTHDATHHLHPIMRNEVYGFWIDFNSYSDAYDSVFARDGVLISKQTLWKALLQRISGRHGVVSMGVAFVTVLWRTVRSIEGCVVLGTLTVLIYMIFYWSCFSSSFRLVVLSSLSAAFFFCGLFCHGSINPKLSFPVAHDKLFTEEAGSLSLGCLCLGYALYSRLETKRDGINSSTTNNHIEIDSSKNRIKSALVAIFFSSAIHQWYCKHPLMGCVTITGGLLTVLCCCVMVKLSYVWKSACVTFYALLLWKWSLSNPTGELYEYLASTIVIVTGGEFFVYLWKAILGGRRETLNQKLCATRVLLSMFFFSVAAVVSGIHYRSFAAVLVGLVTLTIFFVSAVMVLHPYLLCCLLCILVLIYGNNVDNGLCNTVGKNRQMDKIVCAVIEVTIDVVMGPLGVALLSCVSLLPMIEWMKILGTDAITNPSCKYQSLSHQRLQKHQRQFTANHHLQVLWIYGHLYTADLAIRLNLFLSIISILFNINVFVTKCNIFCISLWICRQGFLKFKLNFALALLFVGLGAWMTNFYGNHLTWGDDSALLLS